MLCRVELLLLSYWFHLLKLVIHSFSHINCFSHGCRPSISYCPSSSNIDTFKYSSLVHRSDLENVSLLKCWNKNYVYPLGGGGEYFKTGLSICCPSEKTSLERNGWGWKVYCTSSLVSRLAEVINFWSVPLWTEQDHPETKGVGEFK